VASRWPSAEVRHKARATRPWCWTFCKGRARSRAGQSRTSERELQGASGRYPGEAGAMWISQS
jgi:hypothetical protein